MAQLQQLGKYEIHEELGRGAFATVYRALDITLNREVALKVLHPPLLTDPTFIERFKREAQTMAKLDHQHIATVYEVGEAEERVYIALYLAHGPNLGEALAEQGRLSWVQTLALLQPVCAALDYAHGRGVVHRDLKPANILLDTERGPIITDFGFARLMGDSSVSLSLSGGILGTPAYIAPEVWELDASTAQADIYALGCIVYEMLTGEVLFTGKTPMQAMHAHDQGPRFPQNWPNDVPAGVETVLRKALARDPAARYTSGSAVWHALNGLEAQAQAARAVAEQAAIAAQWQAETEAAIAAGKWSAAKMAAARWLALAPEDADAQTALARVDALAVQNARHLTASNTPKTVPQSEPMRSDDLNRPAPSRTIAPAPPVRAKRAKPLKWILGGVAVLSIASLALIVGVGYLLNTRAATPRSEATFATTATPMPQLPVLIGTAIPQPATTINPENATHVTQLARWGKGTVDQVAYSPNGDILAVASPVGIYLYDAATLEELRWIDTEARVTSVAFAPDGQTLASGSSSNAVQLWRVSDGVLLRVLEGHTNGVTSVAFAPDGQTLASSAGKTVRLWRVSDGRTLYVLVGHTEEVTSVAFAPDGATLASGSRDTTVRLWHVRLGTLLRTLEGHTETVWSVAFAPDGSTLASGAADNTVYLWRLSDGTPLRVLAVHTSVVNSVAFTPDGQILASGSWDYTVQLWQVSDGALLRTIEGYSVTLAPDGQTLASRAKNNTMRLWRVSDGMLLRELEVQTSGGISIAFAPDGQTLASTDGKMVRLRQMRDGTLLHTLEGHTETVWSVAFAPDGSTLASGSDDTMVRLWRVSDGTLLRTLEGHTETVRSVAFAPDGSTLASGSDDTMVRLWRVSDGTLLRTLEGHTNLVYSVAFAPDGTTLASGGLDSTIRLWYVNDGTLLHTLVGHVVYVTSVTFSANSDTLASGTGVWTIQLWRTDDGTLLHTWEGHASGIGSVAFAPNGNILASGGYDSKVRLWRVSDGALLCTLEGHTSAVHSVTFAPDGTMLASTSSDGTIRLWGIPPE